MNLQFSIMGIIGGILCAIGDLLLDLKGKGNQKLGTSKNIDSNWMKMSDWRFGASICFAMVGAPAGGLGMISLGRQMMGQNNILGSITIVCAYFGSVAGIFIHSLLCTQALVYKGIMKKGTLEIANEGLENVYKQVTGPFFVAFIIFFVPAITTIIAIITGALSVPIWCIFLNPIVFMIIGLVLRKINPVVFQDLPGICTNSIGISMLGIIGIMNLM